MDVLTGFVLPGARVALPVLALWVLLRCVRSMLQEGYEPERWARLEFHDGDGTTAFVDHWESILGSAKSCDVVVPGLERTHAALIRSDRGQWRVYDLGGGTFVGDTPDDGRGLPVRDGDVLTLGEVSAVFHPLDKQALLERSLLRSMPGKYVSQAATLLILTVFQALLALQLVSAVGQYAAAVAKAFGVLALTEWSLYFLMRGMNRRGYEPETLAFFLSTLGMAVCASAAPQDCGKQMLLLLAGVAAFLLLGLWLRDLGRVRALRWPVAALALGLLALNLLLGKTVNGASNWVTLGGVTLQPSELVKVAYVYAGAATLDRLYRRRNLFAFIAFSALCVGALAFMGDFGTALIFFVTFLVISFMRSGSFATLFLALAGAALAGLLVLTVKPYIARRFSVWGHVWDDPFGAGWQQTQALSAAARGGLLGVGAGRGWLRSVFAADTDMVFCLVSEELGLLVALIAMLALAGICFFAVRSAARGRSCYYVIAACAASSMMLVQLALNVFGSTDLLPFTGVTFPFVSRGGSSLISCWMLLAFLKSADTRQNSSFSVKLSARRRGAPVQDGDLCESGEEADGE